MNGYHKETNPFTSQQAGIISFNDVRSCGTATAVSVPCMFSNMGRNQFDGNQARNSEGLLDVLQRAASPSSGRRMTAAARACAIGCRTWWSSPGSPQVLRQEHLL